MNKKRTIGSATIDKDGTITIIIANKFDEVFIDALLVYKKEDQDYNEIVSHIGEIETGQEKLVYEFD